MIGKYKLSIGLINKQFNSDILESGLHKNFLDLAIVITIYANGYIKYVNNNWLVTSGMTFDDAYLQAWSNFMKEQTVIIPLNEVISKIKDVASCPPVYVYTNEKRINGAARILDSDSLCQFANDIRCDLIAIPSSIHEWLLIPYDTMFTVDELTEIIREVNLTCLNKREQLSDHPYIFRRNGGWDF